MTNAAYAHVFIDTNTALHYLRPDQIDWCELTGSQHVTLIATPVFLRELEQQKVHNKSRKLRERAALYLKWIVHYMRDPSFPVRAETRWHFIPFEPLIDFPAHNLSRDIADDHLIASILAYVRDDESKVWVATADVGIEMKLRARNIAPLSLPESLRLPEEPDPLEKEIQRLRREAAARHAPRLEIGTDLGGFKHRIHCAPFRSSPSAPSLVEMQFDYPRLEPTDSGSAREADNFISVAAKIASQLQSRLLTSAQIDYYNQKRDKFMDQYSEYLEALLAWEQQAAFITDLKLSLANLGTAPATDIDVVVDFPEGVILMEDNDRPLQPRRPDPPPRPEPFARPAILPPGFDISDRFRNPAPNLPMDLYQSTCVDADRRHARFWIKSLKHGSSTVLEKVCFSFPSRSDAQQFTASYKISAAELPEEVSGTLNFILSG